MAIWRRTLHLKYPRSQFAKTPRPAPTQRTYGAKTSRPGQGAGGPLDRCIGEGMKTRRGRAAFAFRGSWRVVLGREGLERVCWTCPPGCVRVSHPRDVLFLPLSLARRLRGTLVRRVRKILGTCRLPHHASSVSGAHHTPPPQGPPISRSHAPPSSRRTIPVPVSTAARDTGSLSPSHSALRQSPTL